MTRIEQDRRKRQMNRRIREVVAVRRAEAARAEAARAEPAPAGSALVIADEPAA
jgi:hypothetical protein